MSTLTFKVSSKSTAAVLEGVSIVITDGDSEDTLTTDSNGAATYTPTNSSIAYATAIDGYESASGTVEVSSDAEEDIELESASTDEGTTSEADTEETTTSTVIDVAKAAATEAAISTVTEQISSTIEAATTSASDGKNLIEKAADEIKELAAEIKTTKSYWVKIRNTAEIAIITGLIAGGTAELSELASRYNK